MSGKVRSCLESLLRARWYRGQVVHVERIPPKPGTEEPLPDSLHPRVRAYLEHGGIGALYSHQARAVRMAMEGRDIILATGTASGKTLAFALPVLDAMVRDQNSTALFLYPMKALTNDQLLFFERAEDVLKADIFPAIYDGDTPRARRPRIRQSSRLVLSNLYELHQVLPYHHMWARFFAGLKYVIVDEAHVYTGILGSNVAQVFRRFLRVAEHYGSSPTFVLASASIGNPAEHGLRLTSRPVEAITESGAPSGARYVVFFDAAAQSAGTSPFAQTRDVLCHLVGEGMKTLCFAPSRRTAELVAKMVAEDGRGVRVAPYRAGYLPRERREVEQRFRDGEYLGLVATTALELGIDIGDLDAVVLSGYPGSVSAFWQQAGRAGRRGEDSLVVFVAHERVLDQFVLRHRDIVLGGKFEDAHVDLENEFILSGHLLCAASELPLGEQDSETGRAALESLERHGLVRKVKSGYVFSGLSRPHETVKLDAMGDREVQLVDASTGTTLETIELRRALKEAHPNAVYLHMAQTYLVKELDLDAAVASLERKDIDYYTRALVDKTIDARRVSEMRTLRDATVATARLEIGWRVSGFLRIQYDRLIDREDLSLPEQYFETRGIVVSVEPAVLAGLKDPLGALHAVEHTLIGVAPLLLRCGSDDLGGVAVTQSPLDGGPGIFVYDGYPGGIGLSERVYERFDELLQLARRVLRECQCEQGCPACCLSSSCSSNNDPMDKSGGATVIERLL